MIKRASEGPLVLLIGHCLSDAAMLRRTIRGAVSDARVQNINSATKLNAALEGADLLLVNRALDGNFQTSSGVELIGSVRERSGGTARVMLISDFDEAQAQAEQEGALPGFGKSELRSRETRRLLRAALEDGVAEASTS